MPAGDPCIVLMKIIRTLVLLGVPGFITANAVLGDTTVTNGILNATPSVATQGVSGVVVTFGLTNAPTVPPASVVPTSVRIGSILGSSLIHTSQYFVTASFAISLAAPAGFCDVAVTFPNPVATNLTYNRQNGFQVMASSDVIAGFTGAPTYGMPPLTVTFTNISTGMIKSQFWSFGDGSTSTNLNPTHIYSNTASYTVSLSVFGLSASNTMTRVNYLTVSTNLGAYVIVDSGQTACYNTNSVITPPLPGQGYYGQDAQFFGNQPCFTLSGDGKTVFDQNTGLTWMRGPNMTLTIPVKADKKTFVEAEAWVGLVNATNYGGFSDWRLPSIKELYSLFDCRGTDPSSYSGTNTSVLTPFIDTNYFLFDYGHTNLGERIIDSQYASSTTFILNPSENGFQKDFGVNFADGRIKGYDLGMPDGSEKTFFMQLVRGGAGYGYNSFTNNGDGTITDRSTGLMWARTDNGLALLWSNALALVQTKNASGYFGYNDWRLPNIKELQSIISYENAPDYNGLPAIDTNFFVCSQITNEAGALDYPYYWSGSTHVGYSVNNTGGGEADYIPFGRALGYSTGLGRWVDVHGAGCQRSDPKVAPPYNYATVYVVTNGGKAYTGYSWGPQGDAIRGLNYVRLVRGGNNSGVDHVGDGIPDWWRRQYFGGSGMITNGVSCASYDYDGDGLNNLAEYYSDTNPTNSASRLAIISIAPTNHTIALKWIGGSNAWQYIESCPNLLLNQWSAFGTNAPPTDITNGVAPPSPVIDSNLFFRVRVSR